MYIKRARHSFQYNIGFWCAVCCSFCVEHLRFAEIDAKFHDDIANLAQLSQSIERHSILFCGVCWDCVKEKIVWH